MNTSPWDTTGPSQYGTHFYTPGWSPPIPKPEAPKAERREIDIAALKAYRAKRKTQAECACKFGICVETVRALLNEPRLTRAKQFDVDHKKALQMRLQGHSLAAVGKKFGVTVDTIRMHLRERSLPQETQAAIKAAVSARRKPRMKQVGVPLTEKQRAVYFAHGGAAWVRSLIDKETA